MKFPRSTATKLRQLTDHNGWIRAKRLAPVEDIEFASADGTRIEGFLVRPLNYQPGRRYPTILRIHGGPVYQFSHEFMADWQAYAASGYAVVAVNPRGSSGRGFDFARAIYADWGNKDVADVLAGVDHVVKHRYRRPGTAGRSAAAATAAILTNYVIARDKRFKAAVSGAGSSNMLGMYGYDQYTREYELELGTPWANREAYDRTSYPFLHADRIVTPTLFYCAGEGLQRAVPWRRANVPGASLARPCDRAGDLSGREPSPSTVPSYLRDRMKRLLAWYDRFLKSAP